jgi:hypothetical protein
MKRRMISVRSYVHNQRYRPRRRWGRWLFLGLVVVTGLGWWALGSKSIPGSPLDPLGAISGPPKPGDIVAEENFRPYTLAETIGLAKENYGGAAAGITTPVTKITFRYRSELPGGEEIILYARAFLPDTPRTNLPVFGFTTGTTGIGDICSPSLEQPKVANWANYDSHMAMYAAHGFAAVTPDYEGHRDSARIHHYMVGEIEGRITLDAIRALRNLPETRGRLTDNVFLGGYSQGGHAAFWADKIAAKYAPDVKPKGVIGFGPVMSVKQTLTDITRGANINWFGPYVLFSYRDYYKNEYGPVLLPKWEATLAQDVPAHCIDTNIPFWGRSPEGVYMPEFLAAIKENKLPEQYLRLVSDLDRNAVGSVSTTSAKRINQGALDNVVLAAQQVAILPELCSSSQGPVQYKVYPHATHYTTMLQSFSDTVEWMRTIIRGQSVLASC